MNEMEQKYPEIKKFCDATGFNLEFATIGIGKMGVGIVEKKSRAWVHYWDTLADTGHQAAVDWIPEHADKKYGYLMVFMDLKNVPEVEFSGQSNLDRATSRIDAAKGPVTAELEAWIGRINKARFELTYCLDRATSLRIGRVVPLIVDWLPGGVII